MVRAISAVVAACVASTLAGTALAPTLAPAGATCTGSCAERVQARLNRHQYVMRWTRAPLAIRLHLRRIAACESGGDERAVSSTGLYRGLLQFDLATWRSVGGRGDPIHAERIEQWARGVILYGRRGAQPWPVCS